MHDIDPNNLEHEDELDALEADEMEFEFEHEDEFEEGLSAAASPFSEEEEMELAAELLEISSEEELEQFLGKLFKKVKRGISKFAHSKVGRFLGGALKKVAKVGLPLAGRAVGTFFGGPVGGMVGGKLASAAGKLFGLELEGLSEEEAEFEAARRFVRLAGTAAKVARADAVNPAREVNKALAKAARAHAPGLLGPTGKVRIPTPRRTSAAMAAMRRSASGIGRSGAKKTGRWVRRGNRITLLDL